MRVLLLLLFALPAFEARAEEALRVAVAANFAQTLEALSRAYAATSGEALSISSASTGILYTQALHGAPYDLLLAADSERPARLVEKGFADSCTTYAIGRLVLAYRTDVAPGGTDISELLERPGLTLAIANPELAPYGRAARAVLARFPEAAPRILTGANVGQAMQMWVTGGADAAFVAASFSPEPALPVPPTWHPLIEQQAVVLNRSPRRERAGRFMAWLTGDAAVDIIRRHGYLTPGDAGG